MTELTETLADVAPGIALDLACGGGRHSRWLAERGWQVTAVDQIVDPETTPIPGVTFIRADLEAREYKVQPATWDLIACWLYWQADLLPEIASGVRCGGGVALAGKLTGRFATSLANYRAAFPAWKELAAGEDGFKAFFIAVKPQ